MTNKVLRLRSSWFESALSPKKAKAVLAGTAAGVVAYLAESKRSDEEILEDIRRIHNELSPENLHCDGEITSSAGRRKEIRLNRELRAMEKELGRMPTDNEIWGY